MKVVKIHKVLKFKQCDWLKKFMMFNTEKRIYAENLRKRVNVKLVNNKKYYIKYVSRPTFVSQKILDKNLVAIHKIKPV